MILKWVVNVRNEKYLLLCLCYIIIFDFYSFHKRAPFARKLDRVIKIVIVSENRVTLYKYTYSLLLRFPFFTLLYMYVCVHKFYLLLSVMKGKLCDKISSSRVFYSRGRKAGDGFIYFRANLKPQKCKCDAWRLSFSARLFDNASNLRQI